ncbi:GMP synthase (glutamine-hydrolyzing) [Janthinobacterium sp. Marseille]|nr:GMP synthase (glutamine-hydrolyzing) [Janthinobacterium sp. Marseille]
MLKSLSNDARLHCRLYPINPHIGHGMHVHVLQHVPFEGLGSIEEWLQQRNMSISYTRLFESASFPPLDGIDLIIALGGPMSVNDEEELPWLRAEKFFIADAIASHKAVLGICLGSQLIANALGAKVYPAAEKEIGWFPIVAEPAMLDALAFPASVDVFHWHGETFDLPEGAIHLASSAACRNQAFQVGTRVIGLQFHLETTPESADAIIQHCGEELVPQRYIQSEASLRNASPGNYVEINALMASILEYLVCDID